MSKKPFTVWKFIGICTLTFMLLDLYWYLRWDTASPAWINALCLATVFLATED